MTYILKMEVIPIKRFLYGRKGERNTHTNQLKENQLFLVCLFCSAASFDFADSILACASNLNRIQSLLLPKG